MIEQNVKNLLSIVPEKNAFGEKVTLVAAIKLQSPDNINRAVAAGITDVGDNHVQEFRDKFDLIEGAPKRHFIGRLQTNKVKYLIGKTDLYHSLDRINLAEELSARSERCGVTAEALLQINIGDESSKGGFCYGEAQTAFKEIKKLPAIKIAGLMAMLPLSDDAGTLCRLATKMRELYDGLNDGSFRYLSMGMSGDWRLCLDCGSNTIRLGTAIFGQRNYD